MYHTTALSFLRKGYQVIPLSKDTGRPIIKFKDIEMTEELIKSINWANCDYALLMRGIWCLDIDTHKMDSKLAQELKEMLKIFGVGFLSVLKTNKYDNGLDGYSSLLKNEHKEELIINLKQTFVELTASGGMHILFKKREDIPYSQKIDLLDGIDIKANPNNYVKIYPSDGREVLQSVKELPVYVGKFEEEIFKQKPAIITSFGDSVVRPSSNGTHEGREAYERVSNGMSNSRNADLFKAACWAFENGHDISPLRNVIGSVKNGDEFTETEYLITMESARRKVTYVNVGT